MTMVWSAVGSWIERPASLKATTPMTTPIGWRSTIDFAPADIDLAGNDDAQRDEADADREKRPEEGHAGFLRRRARRSLAIRTIARTRSSSVDRVTASTRARRSAAAIAASRASAAARK